MRDVIAALVIGLVIGLIAGLGICSVSDQPGPPAASRIQAKKDKGPPAHSHSRWNR